MPENEKALELYLHIPFCVQKCRYCDFYSAPADKEERTAYVDALLAHLRHSAPLCRDMRVDTVFFGGGTPSLLSGKDFSDLLDCIRQNYQLSKDVEISAECNPESATPALLSSMREAGVTRVSFGFQSLSDTELALLGRIHSVKNAISAFGAARAAGFGNINVDLMFGIPAQTPDSFGKTLDGVIALSPEHISAYELRIEEGTPFFRSQNDLPLPDEDATCDMAKLLIDRLSGAGYRHYEISNFAKEGFACRHNLGYWRGVSYLGFGPAAHSFWGGVRFEAPPSKEAYITAVRAKKWQDIEVNAHRIGGKEEMDEYVMLRMRLAEGVDTQDFSRRFGCDFETLYHPDKVLFDGGFLQKTPQGVAFTERGMRVSNAILSDWLDFGGNKDI